MTISGPLVAKRLRNTPNVRGYLLGYLASVAAAPAFVGAFVLATVESPDFWAALNPAAWLGWWPFVMMFAAPLAAPGALVLVPLLHLALRSVEDQRVHIAGFGVVTGVAYLLALLIGGAQADAVLLGGLLAGICSGLGRWAVSGPRIRTW